MAINEAAFFVLLAWPVKTPKRPTHNGLDASAMTLKSGRYSAPQFAEFKYGR
jgi:hypothetical protein